ncbi:MAG: transposase [Myxococcales bacterium]|nr:MAG: transposase [Myxococcales bacterium]
MSRPLRIDAPGYWHHVMSRGAAFQNIFLCDEDRVVFLDLVADCCSRWGFIIHAFVLMDNHFHVFLQDSLGQLSRGMRHLIGVYTQRFNRKHRRDGPLFRGRFRSKVVQSTEYANSVVDYIHRNPVEAGLVTEASNYPWSSASEKALQFGILCEASLCLRDTDAETTMLVYHPSNCGPVWGDATFLKECRAVVNQVPTKATPNVPDGRRLSRPSHHEIVKCIAHAENIKAPYILSCRKAKKHPARFAAMVLCARFSGLSAQALGAYFGVSAAGIRAAVWRFRHSESHRDSIRHLQHIVEEHLAHPRRALDSKSLASSKNTT